MPTAILRAVAVADTAAAEGKLASFGQSFSKTALSAGAAFAAIGAVVAVSVKAFQQHQEVVIQLERTIGRMPALAGATTKAFEDQATALQNLTGYEDEQILAADTVLARFQLTQDQLQQLIPLILDYARATGTDATTAASNIGRALLGNTRALKTIGISFKATGDTAADLATIMQALQTRVGGAAQAFGKTMGGQVDIAKARLNDIEETIGSAVVPVLTDLLRSLQPVIESFGKAVTALKPLLTLIGEGVGLAVKLFLLQWKPLIAALTFFGDHAAAIGNFFIRFFINPVIEGLNALLNAVDTALGPFINFPDIPKLKTLATDVHHVASETQAAGTYVGGFTDSVDGMPGPLAAASGELNIMAGSFGAVANEARTAANMVDAYLNNLHNLKATTIPGPGGGFQTRASGGPVAGGTPYIVGEKGQELFVPESNGRIVPNGRMAEGGGTETIIIQIDSEEVGRVVRRKSLMRTGGRR